MTHRFRRPEVLLLIGAVAGALLATTGLLAPRPSADGNTVAAINGSVISKADYLGYLDLLGRDKRNPMSAEDRRHVLDRLIEERLLVERALNIDLPRADPRLRKSIVNTMLQTAADEADMSGVDEQTLEAFYAGNLSYFSSPSQLAVRRMVFRGEDAESRAQQAVSQLGGQSWEQLSVKLADRDILSLPSGLLPLSKLRGYIGPSMTDAAAALMPGQHSAALADQGGYVVLQLLDRRESSAAPLAEIREQVLREYERRQREQAVRDYLDMLRGEADLWIDEDFLISLDQVSAQ